MRRILFILTFVVTSTLGWVAGVQAADSGTVGVSVSGAAPCVTVSGSFAYGTLPFATANNPQGSGFVSGPLITNCAGVSEQFVGHVSNLVNGLAVWTPSASFDPCPTLDTFYIQAENFDQASYTALSATDHAIGSLTAAEAHGWTSQLFMPCAGSSGAGLSMSGQIIVTASF